MIFCTGHVPFRIESASSESAAQCRSHIGPVVNAVPAHWLKCFWLHSRMADSMSLLSYSVSTFPVFVVRCMKVTPGFGGLISNVVFCSIVL